MEWQPINKHAPAKDDASGNTPGCLCYLAKDAVDESCYRYMISNAHWLNGKGAEFGVTHWMPLPPPPKGED